MTPLSQHIESFVDPDKEIAKGLAAPDNLHEIMSGRPAVTPLDEPPALAPLEIANEPLPAEAAPPPKPRAKRKPKSPATESESSITDA